MIDLHYWPTPNSHKITLWLEETATPYRIVPVNIREGEQFKPEFLAISPNNRMPAIVDSDTGISVFESGAILLYLADKTRQFVPADAAGRAEVLQWLMWQMGGLGPMMGQTFHFSTYAPEKIPYAIQRYTSETTRLLGVMDRRLADRPFLAGDAYSIADMAAYPWANIAERLAPGAAGAHVNGWLAAIKARPATQRAYAIADRPEFADVELTDAQKATLFGTRPAK
jgi:GSH-dependent disulfide-bond oxidoreductase